MKRKQLKFAVGSIIIVLTLSYLAYSGYQESKTYYHTVPELYAMKDQAYDKRLQVSGDVIPGSIKREGKIVSFVIGTSSGTGGQSQAPHHRLGRTQTRENRRPERFSRLRQQTRLRRERTLLRRVARE